MLESIKDLLHIVALTHIGGNYPLEYAINGNGGSPYLGSTGVTRKEPFEPEAYFTNAHENALYTAARDMGIDGDTLRAIVDDNKSPEIRYALNAELQRLMKEDTPSRRAVQDKVISVFSKKKNKAFPSPRGHEW